MNWWKKIFGHDCKEHGEFVCVSDVGDAWRNHGLSVMVNSWNLNCKVVIMKCKICENKWYEEKKK